MKWYVLAFMTCAVLWVIWRGEPGGVDYACAAALKNDRSNAITARLRRL